MSALQLGEWTDTVPLIQCPTLLIYASGIVTGDLARAAEATNERFSSHQIANAGHNVRREQFERFVEVAQEFLEV